MERSRLCTKRMSPLRGIPFTEVRKDTRLRRNTRSREAHAFNDGKQFKEIGRILKGIDCETE